MLRIFSSSHSFEPWQNRSDTFMFMAASGAGPIGPSCYVKLNHGLYHAVMEVPLPTTHPRFWASRYLPISTPFQPCDDEDLSVHSMKLSSEQYIPSKTRGSRISGLFMILQLSFPRNASLKAWKSWNQGLRSPLAASSYPMKSKPSFSFHSGCPTKYLIKSWFLVRYLIHCIKNSLIFKK